MPSQPEKNTSNEPQMLEGSAPSRAWPFPFAGQFPAFQGAIPQGKDAWSGFDRQPERRQFFAGHLTIASCTFTVARDETGRFRISGVPDRIDWTFEAEQTPLQR